jgi:glycosyltransferase involved in cell wall biosynthesis
MPGRVSARDRNGLLKMADAMVFPSEYEGFGAPVIEAMMCATPVIASDRGSLPEVVGDAGVVAPLTVDAWNGALGTARARRDELVEAGRRRVRGFTTALSASDLVREYDLAVIEAGR